MEWIPLIGEANPVVVFGLMAVASAVVLVAAIFALGEISPTNRHQDFVFGIISVAIVSIVLFGGMAAVADITDTSNDERESGVTRSVRSQPSRLPESVFRGLVPVRVEAELPDGSRGSIVIYGRRSEGAFAPVAYRARFSNPSGESNTAIWRLALPSDRSGLARVEPKSDIRADGRWQEGRTTFGSFSTNDTAEVEVIVGDRTNWSLVPVAL